MSAEYAPTARWDGGSERDADMRILKLSWFYEYPYGGAEIVARMLQRGLEERGHRVDVLCLGGGPLPQEGRIWRIELPRFLYRFPWPTKVTLIFLYNRAFDAWFLRRARRLDLPWAEYDHLHCHDLHCLTLASSMGREFGIPAGSTIHEMYPRFPLWSGGLNPMRLGICAALKRRDAFLKSVFARFAWVAGVSDFITRGAASYSGIAGFRTVYNPVLFPAGGRPALEGDRSKLRLLFIGRLCREKGIDLLLEAFTKLDPGYELTILGLHGPLKSMVEAAARGNPRIRLAPAVGHDRISDYYFGHDILCLPSLCEESFGLAVAEGRTHGCAIVTTRQGGLPEVVAGYPKAVTIQVKGLARSEIVTELTKALRHAAALRAMPLDPLEEERTFGNMRLDRCLSLYEDCYNGKRDARGPRA